jgi:hypothetical protein
VPAGADTGLNDFSFSTPVITVAGFAFLAEEVAPGGDFGRIISQRVGACFRFGRDALVQEPGRDFGFDRPRLHPGARQTGHEPLVEGACRDDHCEDHCDCKQSRPCGTFNATQLTDQSFAVAVLSRAARRPWANLIASSLAQKCIKKRRGRSASM